MRGLDTKSAHQRANREHMVCFEERMYMAQVAFSQHITIQILRRAMEYFAVLEHVRRLGTAGLIAVGEPCGDLAIHVPSISPAGEAMLGI